MQDVQFNYAGKNFVVVGASSGIGKQIALELAQAGANVLCMARRVEIIEKLKEFQGEGKIYPAHIDVTKATSKDWDSIIKNFVGETGKISGGVYTAGVSGFTPLRQWNEELANQIMDTSYWGMIRFIQSATKKRFANDGSAFVTFSSTAAYAGNQGVLVYASAKAAVQTAVKVIAREISQNNHRINSVSPGWVEDTGMTNAHEEEFPKPDAEKDFLLGSGTVEKVSPMVLFLLSEKANWITGRDIVIDGGQLIVGG